jgi:peroxiredoxin
VQSIAFLFKLHTALAKEIAMALEPGQEAPAFSLHGAVDQRISERPVSLRDYRGRNLILVYYPADWSPVCSDQLPIYNELLPEFRRLGAEVAAISVDGAWCHQAFAKDRKLRFALLSDFEPKGAVSKAYGVYRKEGISERALFVIDGTGVIRWSYVSPIEVNPGADGILDALEKLQGEKR